MSKKIVSLLLALTMTLCCCSALAENTKHERVYVVTKPDGTVESITDNVRLENADGLDELIDQTMLTSIENLGGKETFTLEGETLTWQAKGNDISYQGTSEKIPTVLPIVHLMLDGQEISAEELKDKTGDVRMTVSYQVTESLPVLAVTVLPLPETGITDLKLENATILSEMGRQVLVGWAVPGMDEKLELPASFMRDYSRNLSVRMTEEQYQRLQRYMGMTRLNSTAYFCRLIQGNEFKGRSSKLNHALHTSINMIYSNANQISRHQRAKNMDAEAVGKFIFLVDKLCEEVYLLSRQK